MLRQFCRFPLLLLSLSAPACAQTRIPERLDLPLPAPVAQGIVDDIDQALRRSFAHWQGVPEFRYDSAFAAYRITALAAPDRRQFSLLTEAFIARLNNGHTQFNDPALYRADPGNLGFSLRLLEDGWVVTTSRRPALPAGSVVRRIDSIPFETFYQRVRGQLNASNERTRRSGLTAYSALFPVVFSLTLDDGRSVRIDRTVPLPPAPAPSSDWSMRWLAPDSVLYVALRSFRSSATERAVQDSLKAFDQSRTTIILDVRGNGGGNTPSRLGRQLLDSGWRFWRLAPPPAPVLTFTRTVPVAPRFIVLIDRGCGSACEDFVMPFSLSDEAVLIGETTGGSSGQPRIIKWETGMDLWVGARRQWFPDGREFEGVGVAPDRSLVLRATDYRDGATDRVLQCALRYARRERVEGC